MYTSVAVLLAAAVVLQMGAGQDVPIEGMDPDKLEVLRQVMQAAPDREDAIQLAMRAVFDDMRRAARAQGADRKATPTAALQAALDRGGQLLPQADAALQGLARELARLSKQTSANFTSCLAEEREQLLELESQLGSEALDCVMGGVKLLSAVRALNQTALQVSEEAKRCSQMDDTLLKVQCRSQLLVEQGPQLLLRTAELKELVTEKSEDIADQVEEHVSACLPAGSPLDLEVQDLLAEMVSCTKDAVAASEGQTVPDRDEL